MQLRSKWLICALLFSFMLASGSWLNRMIQENRSHYVMKSPVPGGSYRNYSSLDSVESGQLRTPYLPREYVKIVNRERSPLNPFDK
ncbi:hypothetical protein RB620_20970 [Paenibacillus sp. LHD-117]|uniref:hypothetical protein n=1 Tax=Paenibacillus sp. LHD-117 TaxID=3071412 RepID=UPI0027DF72F3|nr:hypothetical protein [Paenibacillus sp. LHD-117]MDQ6421904.1 hypothetical protein [Paenibacillus sp. LHD-117]